MEMEDIADWYEEELYERLSGVAKGSSQTDPRREELIAAVVEAVQLHPYEDPSLQIHPQPIPADPSPTHPYRSTPNPSLQTHPQCRGRLLNDRLPPHHLHAPHHLHPPPHVQAGNSVPNMAGG